MNKTKTQLAVSDKATGIVLKNTGVSTDNRRGVVQEINIFPQRNMFQIKYLVEYLDAKGEVFKDVKFNIKVAEFRDEGEWGMAEFDSETLQPKMTTYEKLTEENLNVTNWYKILGKQIMESAIAFIKSVEELKFN